MAKLTPAQRQYIRKHTKVEEPDPSEVAGELNIIPFLDITVNLIMFLLMLTTTLAFFAQLEARLPEYSRGGVGKRSSDGESLNLNITITENGVIVTGSGGKLAPGCTNVATGRVVTVPKKGGDYDWEGLTACAAEVKKEFPDETQVTVSGEPLVEFQYVVDAMDAMRADGDEELFPDVMLSAGVR
jgi:biopolymer transport protein ExbD